MKVKPRITIARYEINHKYGRLSFLFGCGKSRNYVYFSQELCFLDFSHRIRGFLGHAGEITYNYTKSYRLLNR